MTEMTLKLYWTGFYTLFAKEVKRFFRIWTQSFLPPAISMTLYFLIFGSLIGPRIGEMGGYSYISFIVPGLIMMSIITNSYANVASSFYLSKFQNNIEEILVSPMPEPLIFFGYVLAGVVRGFVTALLVLAVSLFFTDIQVHSLSFTLVTVFLTALLFSVAGFLNGLLAKNFDAISIVPTFVLTPLTYLGGVFYSIDMLPEFWRNLSLGNPILYMVNAFRYGMLGHSDVNIWLSFSIILGFTVVFSLFTFALLKRGVGIRS